MKAKKSKEDEINKENAKKLKEKLSKIQRNFPKLKEKSPY